MKAAINNLLHKLNLEVHGSSYIKKLRNSDPQKDAFQTQQDHVKNPKTIFDVGANRGWVTKRYAEMYPNAVIHAFEPCQAFSQDFQTANNGNKNIRLVNKALSDKTESTILFVNSSPDTNSLYQPIEIGASSDKSCKNLGQITVLTDTVDHYCKVEGIKEIDILKMDTQGSELAILQGAKTLLENKRITLIYTEAYFQPQYQGQPLLYDIANYLKEYGYFLEEIYEPYYNNRHLLWCDAIFTAKLP